MVKMLKKKYKHLRSHLNEKTFRLCIAADASLMGHGGVTAVAEACQVSRNTVYSGLRELKGGGPGSVEKIRRSGGGRKKLQNKNPHLLQDLNGLVDPTTRGDPVNPLKWTTKSTTNLADELKKMGHKVSQKTVWTFLDQLGYSMQSNRKTKEGIDHPDRDAQFQYISDTVRCYLDRNQPVISVDTKKKELIGQFKNNGREWQKKGEPEQVNVHDFADKELGKVVPYGVYDIAKNKGWVNVGISSDTAEFAVESIRRWWRNMGGKTYPGAKSLLITADGGGSNGWRVRLWKIKLQEFSNEVGIPVQVCHFPPGTSKWNKIEHRMFCHTITVNLKFPAFSIFSPPIFGELGIFLVGFAEYIAKPLKNLLRHRYADEAITK